MFWLFFFSEKLFWKSVRIFMVMVKNVNPCRTVAIFPARPSLHSHPIPEFETPKFRHFFTIPGRVGGWNIETGACARYTQNCRSRTPLRKKYRIIQNSILLCIKPGSRQFWVYVASSDSTRAGLTERQRGNIGEQTDRGASMIPSSTLSGSQPHAGELFRLYNHVQNDRKVGSLESRIGRTQCFCLPT